MDTVISMKEGFIAFRGYKVWYGIVGDSCTSLEQFLDEQEKN